ncbi:MAG: DUF4271 domain-containing protein [Bacteroidales bacterium]|nr:DUF4271 domain-containing protein [Bacteroidales bacterium]
MLQSDLATVYDSAFFSWEPDSVPALAPQQAAFSLDTLFPHTAVDSVVQRASMFLHHTMQPTASGYVPIVANRPPLWIFFLLLALAVVLYSFFRNHKLKILKVAHATVSLRALDGVLRDSNLTRNSRLAPVAFVLAALLAVVVYQAFLPHESFFVFLLIFAALVFAYFLRNWIMLFLADVYGQKQAIQSCIVSNYFYHLTLSAALAVLLLPAVYLPVGSQACFIAIAALMLLCFISRIVRSLSLLLARSKKACFFLFYYLCIVEFLPLLVAVRMFILQ